MALSKVSDLAVNVYKGGPGSTFNAILGGGGVMSLADQLTTPRKPVLVHRLQLQ